MIMQSFNPRAREGRDQLTEREDGSQECVSIHAPARGATGTCPPGGSGWSSFNPRAREGRDGYPRRTIWGLTCFNPRAREGRDVTRGAWRGAQVVVSIHAPARGAT